MSYSVHEDLDAIKEKIEDLFTSKFDNLSTEEINRQHRGGKQRRGRVQTEFSDIQRLRTETIRPQEHRVQLEVKSLQRFFPELKQETKDNINFNIETTNPRTHISHDTKP